jgi:LysM repeat protein
MHRDKKLGLALGILLLGVVGAFFFRNEADPLADLPVLEDAAILDEQIAESPITPYLTPPEFAGTSDDLLEAQTDATGAIAAQNISLAGPPDPIITSSNDLVGPSAVPVPQHNRAWIVSEPRPASAQTGPAPISQPQSHRVQQGDTLSGLAQRYLGSSTRYLEIYTANRDLLRNPNDLRVGMTIRIPSPHSEPAAPPQSAGPAREHRAQPVSATQPANPASPDVSPPPGASPRPQPPAAEPARRFVPARRPLWPLRRPAAESSRIDSAPGAIRSLTQIPPSDLTIEPPGR